MNEGLVPTPRPPQTTTVPGAFAVEGPDARHIVDVHSITSPSDRSLIQPNPTITAQLVVDNIQDHFESLEEQI